MYLFFKRLTVRARHTASMYIHKHRFYVCIEGIYDRLSERGTLHVCIYTHRLYVCIEGMYDWPSERDGQQRRCSLSHLLFACQEHEEPRTLRCVSKDVSMCRHICMHVVWKNLYIMHMVCVNLCVRDMCRCVHFDQVDCSHNMLYEHAHTHTHTHTRTHTHTHTHAWSHAHTHTYIQDLQHVCMYVCVSIHIHIYIYIYIYIHIYKHRKGEIKESTLESTLESTFFYLSLLKYFLFFSFISPF
jgi:hypothetical protein